MNLTGKAPVVLAAVSAMLLIALTAQAPWATDATPVAGAGDGNDLLAGAAVAPGIVQVALAGAAAAVFAAFADGALRVVGGLLVAAAGIAAGALSVRAGLAASAVGVWPWLASALAVLAIVAGVSVVLLSRRWGRSSRRFAAENAPGRGGGRGERPAGRDSVSDWDRLSRGDDPTA